MFLFCNNTLNSTFCRNTENSKITDVKVLDIDLVTLILAWEYERLKICGLIKNANKYNSHVRLTSYSPVLTQDSCPASQWEFNLSCPYKAIHASVDDEELKG